MSGNNETAARWAMNDPMAVTNAKDTEEWKILNRPLREPTLRARRADAHRSSVKDHLRKIIGTNLGAVFTTVEQDPNHAFPYSPIDPHRELRILRLYQAGNADEPLKADIFKRNLRDVYGGYEALSYCWGTGRATHVVQIRDLNAGTQDSSLLNLRSNRWRTALATIAYTNFKIRENLCQALTNLRSKYHDVYIWVDAICIDQSENGKTEKEGQLAMMSTIYNSASNVCIWLGQDHANGAKSAFQLVQDIMNYRNFDIMACDPERIEQWTWLISIMKSDWFSRRWVIQEIALSRNATVHCGDHKVHWDDFADAVSLLTEKIDVIRSHFGDEIFGDVEATSACVLIQTLTNICRKADHDEDKGMIHGRLLDVETLVSTLLGFQATFPRDTIYSILSLAKDSPTRREDWQRVHQRQLERTRDEKLSSIKHKLDLLRERRNIMESDLDEARDEKDELETQLRVLDGKRSARLNARTKGRADEVRRLTQEIRDMRVEELEAKDAWFKNIESSVHQNYVQIKRMEYILERTSREVESQPIGLLPNYDSSPRDLFIGFVTRSIFRSKSLDIICRHWAPALSEEDGGGLLPSWISSLARTPYGVPGISQGRQNGENFVAYLPYDQRRRYSASGTSKVNFKVKVDPALTRDDIGVRVRPAAEYGASAPDYDGTKWKPNTVTVISQETDRRNATWGLVSPDESISRPHAEENAKTTVALARGEGTPLHINNHRAISQEPLEAETAPEGRDSRPETPSEYGSAKESREPSPDREATKSPPSRVDSGPELSAPDAENSSYQARRKRHEAFWGFVDLSAAVNDTVSGNSTNQKVNPPNPRAVGPHRLSGIVVVEGFVLGRIAARSEAMRGGIIPGEWVAKLGWKKGKDNGNQVPDTLWRLLVADRTPQGGRPPQWYKRACLHGLVDSHVSDSAGNIHPMTRSDTKISELTSKYFGRVESVVWNRRIIEIVPDKPSPAKYFDPAASTPKKIPVYEPTVYQPSYYGAQKSGPRPLFGLGPEESEIGGIVCIFFGCSVPVVLRAAKRQRVEFLCEVVGESYVHGMMDGEAMLVEGLEQRTRMFRLG